MEDSTYYNESIYLFTTIRRCTCNSLEVKIMKIHEDSLVDTMMCRLL